MNGEPPVNGTFANSRCSGSMGNPQTIVRFPTERVPRTAVGGATHFQIWRGRFRDWIGRVLNRAGAPGAIRDMELSDALTKQQIAVSVGSTYVRLTVNERDYYFDRLTGRLTGSGGAP